MVLAERGRGFVQEILADVGDADVNLGDLGFCFPPVAAELDLAAHRPLVTRQPLLVLLEAVERRDVGAIAQRGKAGDTDIDADGGGRRGHGRRDLPLGLDRHEPRAARLAHGNVAHLAQHVAAVAIAQPAELGQEDPAIALIELDLLRIGVAEAVALALLLEAREIGALGEEVGVGAFQILERLLLRVYRPIGQPWSRAPRRQLSAVAPCREFLAQPGVAQLRLTALVAFLLQSQGLVEYEPTRPREAAHVALLFAVRHEFVFEGLEPLHDSSILLVYGKRK